MGDALIAALGEPAAEVDGEFQELRWARPDATLLLRELARSIKLSLVTNEWLTAFDHRVQLSRQGKL